MKPPSFKPKILFNKKEIPRLAKIIDSFDSSLAELFFIENPQYKKNSFECKKPLKKFLAETKVKNIWIYFPDSNIAVRSVPEDIYYKLRTSRNRNIITQKEQLDYRNLKVGIAGLSVGSGVLSSLVMTGGPKTLKIADFDVVEVSNLNRIRAKITDLGSNKTFVAAREVWELDPFADLHLFGSGLTEGNLEKFILNNPCLDILIDEMDSLDLKIKARLICKKNKIPVLMATDNGDGIIVDVERFDLDPKREIFHGLLRDVDLKDIKNIDRKIWVDLAIKIIGEQNIAESVKSSVSELGKTLSGIPQLGTTAMLAGASMAYVVRKIANKEKVDSGKYKFNLEDIF